MQKQPTRVFNELAALLVSLLRPIYHFGDIAKAFAGNMLGYGVANVQAVEAVCVDEQGIAVRGGLHCAPGVHRFLGTLNIGAVRVSPGLMNTAAEAGKLIDAVWKIAKAR